MKEINLRISDKVYLELRSCMGIKGLAGNVYGTPDTVLLKIIKSIEEGDKEVFLAFKEGDPEKDEAE